MENKDKRQALIDAFADYVVEHNDRIVKGSGDVVIKTTTEGGNYRISDVSFSIRTMDNADENWENMKEWSTLFMDMYAEYLRRI